MDAVHQFFNFCERCQHALVDLHPYFAVMFIEMRFVPTSVQIVYRGYDFYAQDFLLAGVKATSSFYVLLLRDPVRQKILLRDQNDRHPHGIPADVPHSPGAHDLRYLIR